MRAALLLALALAGPRAAAQPVPRTVLALYQPQFIPGKVKDVYFHQLHQQAEMPLNNLGLVVDYVDVSKPLPPVSSFKDVRGVVTWFTAEDSFADPRPLCRWLAQGQRAGWRVVMLGKIGLYTHGQREHLVPECASMLKTLGVEAAGTLTVDPLDVAVASATAMLGFEREPDPSERGFVPMTRLARGAAGTPELALSLSQARWPQTQPVIVTPRGGVALDPFLLYSNQELDPVQYRWIVDPFAFLAAAFGTRGLPAPDPTTLSGRRLFVTHVDGDGFFNLSELDRTKTSGEIFLNEIVEKMPDVPFTMSLIAGYYDLALYDDAESLELGRRVLDRPNVEPASHGYAHPMIWRTGAVALKIPRYTYDVQKEVVGAARMLSRLMLGGKPINLMLWTGDALPTEEALAAAQSAGMLQMNGGGGRFDDRYPSYAYLFPLSRQVGGQRQIYAADSNENVFTGLWTGPFYGYREAIETFKRTGSPRRVKPVDVYVHYYSAERYASLQALKEVYAWARAQPFIEAFASRYALAARDFFSMKIERTGPRRFRLTGGAGIGTVRFDDEPTNPDMRASKGVVGWRREHGALYVTLASEGPREVALGAKGETGPRLEEASFEVSRWRSERGGVSFFKRGWGLSECTLAGLRPGRQYSVEGGGLSERAAADKTGRLVLRFPDSERGRPAVPVEVKPA